MLESDLEPKILDILLIELELEPTPKELATEELAVKEPAVEELAAEEPVVKPALEPPRAFRYS